MVKPDRVLDEVQGEGWLGERVCYWPQRQWVLATAPQKQVVYAYSVTANKLMPERGWMGGGSDLEVLNDHTCWLSVHDQLMAVTIQ